MTRRPHVAIIGAGFAGLRCADILLQNGAQVTIFEARNRVGGRVFQTTVGGHAVDLGPNFIHGSGANPIVSLAQLTSTELLDVDGAPALYSGDGSLVDEKTAGKVAEFVWSTIGEAFKYSNSHKDTIPPEKSLLDFFHEQLEKTDFSPEEKRLCLESSNYFVASTYKHILKHVSNRALQDAEIRYNQPIVKIESRPIIQGTSTRQEITLTTEAGETSQFDEVVVTCPLGWLKRNKSAFIPELPPRLTSAIDSISYGRLEKVYVTFPRAFWKSEPVNMVSLPVNGSESHTNDPSTDLTQNQSSPFAQFLHPAYTEVPAGIPWNQECLSMASFPEDCAHPTLLFYTYGPCATHIVSTVSAMDPASSEYYTFLDNFTKPFYSRLHGYSSSSPDCTPKAFLATQWQNDPYAGNGSYCNFQVGLQQGDEDIEVLRAGVGLDHGIWFAGEHTSPFVALGTTTGAFWSGERAGGQICARYGLGKAGVGLERDDSLPSAAMGE
ncbi:hypothetical protein ARAM_001925 [Aspergillus rambellii]|uniref:Amine oxidase domain-containing protein n=1 Tax=Aspergillus rambellii TaxID=308745 RepID=A0A0F8U6A4_9EURO|nr:hypothetical protein ARAM_001925 [Aspergillus rambellii]